MIVQCGYVPGATPVTANGILLFVWTGICGIKEINSQHHISVPMCLLWFNVLAVHPMNHSNPPKSQFRQKFAVAGVAPEFFDHWSRWFGLHLQHVSVVPTKERERNNLRNVLANVLWRKIL
jgi:hypothetical protein